MASQHHKTVPVQVWVDVDEGIAETVKYLNTLPGVRTLASCQGTLDEGGPNPYPPQVMISWSDKRRTRHAHAGIRREAAGRMLGIRKT